MSVEVVPGGQRRIDRVLDPGFTEEVGQLGLLQGRLNILRAELVRRSAGGEHRRRVERLVSDETIARLPELDVEELTRAVDILAREEEQVSANRRAVQRVVDLLRGE